MSDFDDHADLLAVLKRRVDRAASRLIKAQRGWSQAQGRAADAQATYDTILAQYEKARSDALLAAKG